MKITATGRLRHQFWGDYSANIILIFDSELECDLAIPYLNKVTGDAGKFRNAAGGISDSIEWINSGKYACIVLAGDPLERAITALKELGACDDMDSCNHSIDYGSPFEISMEAEDPNQTTMKL